MTLFSERKVGELVLPSAYILLSWKKTLSPRSAQYMFLAVVFCENKHLTLPYLLNIINNIRRNILSILRLYDNNKYWNVVQAMEKIQLPTSKQDEKKHYLYIDHRNSLLLILRTLIIDKNLHALTNIIYMRNVPCRLQYNQV